MKTSGASRRRRFYANDRGAFGCIEALLEVGLGLLEDISAAGYDDTLTARACLPLLSTVRQQLRQTERRAVELLLVLAREVAGKPAAPASPIVFATATLMRASFAAVRSA